MHVVVPLSGGWDSTLCALHARAHYGTAARLVMFDYGQAYATQEWIAAQYVAETLGVPIEKLVLPSIEEVGGVFCARNLHFMRALSKMAPAPDVVYFGCRNPTPVFDRFGDSNWVWGKLQQYRFGFRVRMPCVLLPKSRILNTLRVCGLDVSKLYSTDPAAREVEL